MRPESLPLLAACLLATAGAHAEPTGLELDWQAPASCPTKSAVIEQIDELIAAPERADAPLRSVSANARVEETDAGFRLELELHDGDLVGHRTFDGASCGEVTGAAAVAIALLLRPPEATGEGATNGSASGDAASGATTTDAETGEAGVEEASNRAPEAAPDERRLHFVLALPTLDVGFFLFPEPSPGLGGGLGLEAGPYRLLAQTVWRGFRFSIDGVPDGVATVERLSTSLSGCRWFDTYPELAPCLNASLELLQAAGAGPGIVPSSASAAWFALGPSGLLRVRARNQFAMTVRAGLNFHTARPVLSLEGVGEVAQASPLELTLGFGMEWIF